MHTTLTPHSRTKLTHSTFIADAILRPRKSFLTRVLALDNYLFSPQYAAYLKRPNERCRAAVKCRNRPVAGDTRQASADSRRELASIEEVLKSGTTWWDPRDLGPARYPR